MKKFFKNIAAWLAIILVVCSMPLIPVYATEEPELEDDFSDEVALSSDFTGYERQWRYMTLKGYDVIKVAVLDNDSTLDSRERFIVVKKEEPRQYILFDGTKSEGKNYFADMLVVKPEDGVKYYEPRWQVKSRGDVADTTLIEGLVPVVSKSELEASTGVWDSWDDVPFYVSGSGSIFYKTTENGIGCPGDPEEPEPEPVEEDDFSDEEAPADNYEGYYRQPRFRTLKGFDVIKVAVIGDNDTRVDAKYVVVEKTDPRKYILFDGTKESAAKYLYAKAVDKVSDNNVKYYKPVTSSLNRGDVTGTELHECLVPCITEEAAASLEATYDSWDDFPFIRDVGGEIAYESESGIGYPDKQGEPEPEPVEEDDFSDEEAPADNYEGYYRQPRFRTLKGFDVIKVAVIGDNDTRVDVKYVVVEKTDPRKYILFDGTKESAAKYLYAKAVDKVSDNNVKYYKPVTSSLTRGDVTGTELHECLVPCITEEVAASLEATYDSWDNFPFIRDVGGEIAYESESGIGYPDKQEEPEPEPVEEDDFSDEEAPADNYEGYYRQPRFRTLKGFDVIKVAVIGDNDTRVDVKYVVVEKTDPRKYILFDGTKESAAKYLYAKAVDKVSDNNVKYYKPVTSSLTRGDVTGTELHECLVPCITEEAAASLEATYDSWDNFPFIRDVGGEIAYESESGIGYPDKQEEEHKDSSSSSSGKDSSSSSSEKDSSSSSSGKDDSSSSSDKDSSSSSSEKDSSSSSSEKDSSSSSSEKDDSSSSSDKDSSSSSSEKDDSSSSSDKDSSSSSEKDSSSSSSGKDDSSSSSDKDSSSSSEKDDSSSSSDKDSSSSSEKDDSSSSSDKDSSSSSEKDGSSSSSDKDDSSSSKKDDSSSSSENTPTEADKFDTQSFSIDGSNYELKWSKEAVYDGRKHVALGMTETAKQVGDITFSITRDGKVLDPSTYKLKFKNNVNAVSKKAPEIRVTLGKGYSKSEKKVFKKMKFFFKIAPANAKAENFTVTKPVKISNGAIKGKLYYKVPGAAKPLKLNSKSCTITLVGDDKVSIKTSGNIVGEVVVPLSQLQ